MDEDHPWDVAIGFGYSGGPDLTLLSQAEKAKLKKELKAKEAKRIEPGFYTGIRRREPPARDV